MAHHTIGEIAERSGFSASALRYYEDIDLVRPAARSEAGYRLYDDAALVRLRFIARAKQLGCSLEDIRDVVAIWDGERCGPVQRRFHQLVTTKLADARRQVDELTVFMAQLRAAGARLAGPATDGPCGDECACTTATTSPPDPVPVTLGPRPATAAWRAEPPVACTLGPDEQADRVADWRALLGPAAARTATPAGAWRVELDEDADLSELARLVRAEQRCCPFFSFAITVDARGVAVEVDAPDGAADLAATLFSSVDQ